MGAVERDGSLIWKNPSTDSNYVEFTSDFGSADFRNGCFEFQAYSFIGEQYEA